MKEKTISFGKNNGLIGTLCLPEGTQPLAARCGVILFNAGVVHRVGPHRINVRLARMLVQKGIPSIRFDLSGMGDSARPGAEHSFEVQAIKDIGFAMDELSAATKLKQFALFGFCSGAAHSYETALVDVRVTGVLLYEAYLYPTFKMIWNRALMRVQLDGILRAAVRITRKLVQAGVNYLLAMPRRGTGFVNSVSNILPPSKFEFSSGVKALLQRGVSISMMQAGSAFIVYNYSNQFRDALKGFGVADRIESVFFPDMDHVATSMNDQHEFMREIMRWVLALEHRPQTEQAEKM